MVEGAGGGKGGELAKRVAGRGGGMRAAELLPAGEGRAVDGGLGEAGSVGYVLEGVGANQLDRQVQEVGAAFGDGVAHAFFMASLPREEQRCVGGLAHHPIVVRLKPNGERFGCPDPPFGGVSAEGRGVVCGSK